jgi:hypothetical protein
MGSVEFFTWMAFYRLENEDLDAKLAKAKEDMKAG